MINNPYNVQDTPRSKYGEAFVTINNRRYSLFNAKDCEAKANIETGEVPVLGRVIKGRKAIGMEIEITMTVYKCSEIFDDVVEEFKKTGVLPPIDIQVTNDDPSAKMGRTSKIYYDCVIDGDVLLSVFDADGEFIEQEITAYADDYSSLSKYKNPEYM